MYLCKYFGGGVSSIIYVGSEGLKEIQGNTKLTKTTKNKHKTQKYIILVNCTLHKRVIYSQLSIIYVITLYVYITV